MIESRDFLKSLEALGVSFISGVPDSLLKDIIRSIELNWPNSAHQIAPNEGAAIGYAIGHHLATGKMSMVYLQNSGLGNALNPLVSLAGQRVYSIPMLLLIGWRGEILNPAGAEVSQVTDEPQHRLQGLITLSLLDLMEIPYTIVNAESDYLTQLREIISLAERERRPTALVVRKGAFKPEVLAPKLVGLNPNRSSIIETILRCKHPDSLIVSTTGLISRELLVACSSRTTSTDKVFPVVGGMGHAVSIANGIARSLSSAKIICIDGDGSLCMHMGAMLTSAKCRQLIHVVINNRKHDSVGGQPTVAGEIPLSEIARATGYSNSCSVSDTRALEIALRQFEVQEGSAFIEILSDESAISTPSRPTESLVEIKNRFMS